MCGVNETYCGDHFAVHTKIESLCCMPKATVILYQLYMNKDDHFKINLLIF